MGCKTIDREAIFAIEAELTIYIQEHTAPDEVHCVGKRREIHTYYYISPSLKLARDLFLDRNENRKPEIRKIERHEIAAMIRVET